jgi:pimeloyl-ACP methyl ester carboxylesterase
MHKMRKLFLSVLLFFILLLAAPAMAQQAEPAMKAQNWYDGFMFKDSSNTFEFIRVLGAAAGGGADLGECIETARHIDNGDDESWYREWMRRADYLCALAEKWDKEAHVVSAREAYLRACNYYRSASFYMDSPENRARSVAAWKKSRECFLSAISSLPYVKTVRIPYESTTLPGYFITCPVSKKKHPLLIIQTGFDGTGEELFFNYTAGARDRGYDCLIFEGPGQGEPLRLHDLHFRHDWEHVITPVVDYSLTLPGIDSQRIALLGISFGGYLVPRAAAYEHRLKACIANGGVYSFADAMLNKMPADFSRLIETDPERFDRELQAGIKNNPNVRWGVNNGMWTFGAHSPAEFYRKTKPFTLEGVAGRITCATLVLDSEDDIFMEGQAERLYKALSCPKSFYRFTREETAQAHCQMGAMGISEAVIFNWLDRVMKQASPHPLLKPRR